MTNCRFSTERFFATLPSVLSTEENVVRILMVGDVIGRPGRRILKHVLPPLRTHGLLDFVIVNAENIAGGFGVTEKVFKEVLACGVDAMTLGNHWADKPDVHRIRQTDSRLVFPQNIKDLSGVDKIPEFDIPNRNVRVSVINLLGLFAMRDEYANPFEYLSTQKEQLTSKVRSGTHIVVADIHAEASSEKQAAAWFLDGVAACVVGTHTHTPTSDERILPEGTAYLTDLGMTGPYFSVIGMNKAKSLKRHFPPHEKAPHEVATNDPWFSALLVEISKQNNLAIAAHRLQFREDDDEWKISSVVRKQPQRPETGSTRA